MKVKIIDNISYQLKPITDDMIEVDENLLREIGKTKQFKNGQVVDYIPTIPISRQIAEIKSLLAETDYIDNKLTEAIAEAMIIGDSSKVIALKQEYSKQLSDRVFWRQQINELENSIQGS